MIPILFDVNEKEFKTQGFGSLNDAVSCKVVEERNGKYELTMTYKIGGAHYDDLKVNRIIFAIPSPYREAQPFRIYKITTPFRGLITVYAQHISYDLSGVVVSSFSASSAETVFYYIKRNAMNGCEFEFFADNPRSVEHTYNGVFSARQLLGGMEGSVLDLYGGEYEFDKFKVNLYQNRGRDSGVSIKYGKNLLDVSQQIDVSGAITGIVPYWKDTETDDTIYGDIVRFDGITYDIDKVITYDFTDEYEEKPTKEQLNERAKSYIKANRSHEPDISCTVSFALIEQSEEYKDFVLLEKCDLCDVVNVQYTDLGINSTAKIVSIDTDVLRDKYNSVTVGSVRANIAQTITDTQKKLEDVPNQQSVNSFVREKLEKAMGTQGGYIRLLDTDEDGNMDTLYIADKEDPKLAQRVWRFNYQGWAASKNGYNGPFELGATLDDGLLASFVTAAQLTAGTIKSKDGKAFYLNLDTGELRMNALEFKVGGNSIANVVENSIGDKVESAVDSAVSPLESRLSKAESTITVHSNQIATKVSEGDVSSLIDQKADSIRMKADNIQWESENSSMSADGTLTCKGANINGDFRAEKYGNCFTTENGYSPILLFSRDNSAFGGDYNWVALSPSYINIGDSYGFDTDEDFIKNFDNIKASDDSLLMIRRAQEAEGVMIRTTGIQVYNPNGGAFGNGYTGTIASNKSIKVVNGIVVGSV